ncbi:MAG: carbamoyl phosphate synthase small subunit [Clostridiales bacterium]|nr:carbamoyl phosphate synthase small subunit [Clostridiales bacterium]
MKAFLILEDGSIFNGQSIGSTKDAICEIVFNTSMTGYLEALTDPSYVGQGMVMTYPLIGNYGTNSDDAESDRAWVSAFIIRELAKRPSNFRNRESLADYLIRNEITGIQRVDTRALTRILREKGTMNGMVTCNEDYTWGEGLKTALTKIKNHSFTSQVAAVSGNKRVYNTIEQLRPGKNILTPPNKYKIAAIDLGIKKNMIEMLLKRGCEVTCFNYKVTAEEILEGGFDGILLSNGPGDPSNCMETVETTKKLIKSNIPIFGICLGHQVIALAAGGSSVKMKYGHRGENHPVKDLESGRVYISAQNHGYVIKDDGFDPNEVKISHINVNDKTVEGIKFLHKKIFSVQYHPEACGGPRDSEYLFDEFIEMVGGN